MYKNTVIGTVIKPAQTFEKWTVMVEFETDQGSDNLVSDWLPIVYSGAFNNKEYWLFQEGERVVCMMDDDMLNGVVIGSIYAKSDDGKHTVPSDADETKRIIEINQGMEYIIRIKKDQELSSEIAIKRDEGITVTAKESILTMKNDGNIEIKGNVKIDGEVEMTKNLSVAQNITSEQGAIEAKAGDIKSAMNVIDLMGTSMMDMRMAFNTHMHVAPTFGGPTTPPSPGPMQ